MPDDFERMWARPRAGRPVGGVRRLLPPALRLGGDASCGAWFVEQAAARGLRVEADAGRQRRSPGGRRPASSGPRRADRLAPGLGARRRGVRRSARRGLGARGGRPAARARVRADAADRGRRCSSRRRGRGSGWPAWARGSPPGRWRGRSARELRDRDGVALRGRAGRPPGSTRGVEPVGTWLLDGVGCFVELHVEQGRDLVDRGAAVGVASEIWPHGRYRFDFAGEANHAGHHPDGGPARPDADLRDDRAGRQQAGPAGRRAGDLRAGRGRRPTAPTRCRRG